MNVCLPSRTKTGARVYVVYRPLFVWGLRVLGWVLRVWCLAHLQNIHYICVSNVFHTRYVVYISSMMCTLIRDSRHTIVVNDRMPAVTYGVCMCALGVYMCAGCWVCMSVLCTEPCLKNNLGLQYYFFNGVCITSVFLKYCVSIRTPWMNACLSLRMKTDARVCVLCSALCVRV